MKTHWLLIDGYSLLHRIEGRGTARRRLNGLARDHLVRDLEELGGGLADRITVVFDGTGKGTETEAGRSAVEVVFSPGHQTADTVIERLVNDAPDPGGILVVTSDRAERETVGAAGANSMGCGDFLSLCEQQRHALASTAGVMRRKTPKSTLGDSFPR